MVCGIFLLVSTEILLFFFLVSSFVLLIVGFIMRFGVLDFCEDDELDRLYRGFFFFRMVFLLFVVIIGICFLEGFIILGSLEVIELFFMVDLE